MQEAFRYEAGAGRIIRGNVHYARADRAEATVVIVHGFKGFKDWGMFPYVAEQLAESFDVVRFNLARNGVGEAGDTFDELDKFGRQTFTGDMEDIAGLVARVRKGDLPLRGRQPGSANVVLLGHSRGGGEAIVFALDEPDAVAGVVSWNGTTRFDTFFGDETLRAMRENGVAYIDNARTMQRMPLERVIADDLAANRGRFDVLGRIGALRRPLVLVQGTNDHRGLIAGSERLTQARPDARWIRIDGGDHTFGAKHPFAGTTGPLEAAIAATRAAVREMAAGQA